MSKKNRQKNRREIIVMCGPSHCGKSTLANQLKGFEIISSDIIRFNLTESTEIGTPEQEKEVWQVFNALKEQYIEKNKNIILDACHISTQARWCALQNVPEKYKKICILFQVNRDTIKQRCPAKWADDMWCSFSENGATKASLLNEGFDEVRIAKGD